MGLEVFQTQNPCILSSSLPPRIDVHRVLPTQEAHQSLGIQVSLRLHHISTIDPVFVSGTQSAAQLPIAGSQMISCGSKPQLSNYIVGLSDVARPYPESSPYHKLSRGI